jgi:hypothetical protein
MMEVLLHPCNEMVLEAAFDDLVKEIRCNKVMNIGTREVIRKRLNKNKHREHFQ